MLVYHLQIFLRQLGFNPGPLDGLLGPKTRAAIRAFQKRNGLVVDGQISTALVDLYTKMVKPETWPAHVHLGLSFVAVEEIPGTANNPTIMEWAEELGTDYDGDPVAWSSLFVAHCIHRAIPGAELPVKLMSPRAYLGFGQSVDMAEIRVGDLVIFWREDPSSWKGHVGFYMGDHDEDILVLGGNQFQSVSVAGHPASQVLGVRRARRGQNGKLLAGMPSNKGGVDSDAKPAWPDRVI